MNTYKRAIKLKSYATSAKKSQVTALIHRYRKQVNDFIAHCWNNETAKLDKSTLSSVSKIQNLSERYKSNALRQALALCNNPMTKSKPKFNGFPILDAKFIDIKPSKTAKQFDLWVKLSVLKSGKPIQLPTKKHAQLNKWLAEGSMIQGCELRPDGFVVWVECAVPAPRTGLKMGVDIGMNKLLTTNFGSFHGTRFNELNDKILRKKKNSVSYKKSLIEKKNYINQSVNELPWSNLEILCYENLKGLTKGTKKRSKKLRQKQQYWSYRQVIDAMKMKAQANRVRLCYVNPAYTSQTCSACGIIAASNRVLEKYSCACGFTQDSDINGAKNILKKGLIWIGSLESPKSKSKSVIN